jgi:hypothetical protein
MYPGEMLDFNKYVKKNQCPANERLINEEAVWFEQSMLLGAKPDMDDIAMAIKKIHDGSGEIKKAIK